MGLFFAFYLAILVGWGVYRSCTRHQAIMRTALALDALCAVVVIAIGHYVAGVW